MLTTYRIAPARLMPFIVTAGLLALGCFDTVQAQNLTVSSTSLAFNTSKGVNPPAQTVSTSSTGASFNFMVSYPASANWLTAATSVFNPTVGTTGQALTVQVSAGGMATGTYTSTITLTPENGSPAVNIAVALTITGTTSSTSYTLGSSLANLYFGYELGQAGPSGETVQITSSGIALPISVSAAVTPSLNCPVGWLQVTSSATSTPATLTATVNTTGLGAGTCGATITVTSNTPANGTTSTVIQVLLYISANALLNVNIPTGLTQVTANEGAGGLAFNIGLTSTDPTVAVRFSVTSTGGPWLAPPAPANSSGTTPNSLYVQIIPGNGSQYPPGVYTGSITITSPGLFQALTIPITFTLLSNSAVTLAPSGAQSFTELQGGALPSPLTFSLSGLSSSTFTTAVTPGPAGGSWLQASPTQGSIAPGSPASLTLSVAPNTLTQGTYSSSATITFVPATIPPITIFVSLTVGAPASALVATPSSLSFTYQTGSPAPASQGVALTNPAGTAIPFTLASISDSWILVTGAAGNTPGAVSVSVTPQNLQPGMYNGSFTLTTTASGIGPVTIPISLFVSASQTPQPFIIGNNSSGLGGQVSPGEIIFIKGSGLGPAVGVTGTSTLLSGVQVLFNGTPGTLLYVSSTQIDAIVPYGVAGQNSVSVVVINNIVPSNGIQLPVVAATLGLSTISQTGTGQAAALNLSGPNPYNTAATPALEGSYISVYGTGGGQTNPASQDGEISPTISLLPLVLQSLVTATIGGKPAVVQFAGAAPGEITGVVQFNLQVPSGVSGPALPIVITINSPTPVQSQAGVTVAVQ
jgi:uncharacterized protein (TIGR03437 family)